MKLEIKELGAIKEATIDLNKKINIFCGPNGTGKTYMAYIIYGLLQNKIHVKTDEDLSKNLINERNITYDINFDELHNYRQNLIENFKDNFDSIFGISENIVNKLFDKTKVIFAESQEEFENNLINSKFKINTEIERINFIISKEVNSKQINIEIENKNISNDDIKVISMYLKTLIVSTLAIYPISSSYILPVERSSIFTFSKELSIKKHEALDLFHAMTSKNKSDDNIGSFIQKVTTRYPVAIRDGLIIAEGLKEIKKKEKSIFYDFAIEIEKELLHGKVTIDDDGEIQFSPEKASKKNLPIHITASIIKSLSSLVIYLKHIAKYNDLIIIDEPEINLHPDNQIILTKLFAQLMNKGFRFLISTHSDYIIREINNLIMVSSDQEQVQILIKKLGYKNDEFIKIEDIEVHFFDYPRTKTKNKQVTIQKVEITSSGFEVSTINDTIQKQNNYAEELYYALNS